MPLLGKIVVIKRNGADGTEFPLTASCLFGRKLDCDIRIQMPQVSKEHCRIELNENKELILTNLSSVNPTRINGETLQQSERLKHGDLITIIDRSFRFEYPPPPTPKKKRLSTSDKGETVKVLQDQQVRSTPGPTDKKKSEHSDNCLKDGSNLPSLDQSMESTKGDDSLQCKPNTDSTMSPFSELYHMVKKDLASKSPWKAAAHPKSPIPRPQDNKGTPKKLIGSENDKPATPKSVKKNRRSSTAKAVDSSVSDAAEISKTEDPVESPPVGIQAATPAVQDTPVKKRRSSSSIAPMLLEASSTPVSQNKNPQVTPQKFSANEVAEQILSVHSSTEKTPKSPKGSSAASQPQSQGMTPKSRTSPRTSSGPKTLITSKSQIPVSQPEESEAKQTLRTSPRAKAVKKFQVQDLVHDFVTTPASDVKNLGRVSSRKHKCDDLHVPVPKRKRVSFGGQLSPELFDKHLPPNSPLRRGATPGRRSLGISEKTQSLLRRASTIGLMGFQLDNTLPEHPSKNVSPKNLKASPAKTSPAKKSSSTKYKTPSPKNQKTPPKTPTLPSVPATPKSSKRVSNSSEITPLASDGSVMQTPSVRGRFSITQIHTPSPDKEVVKDCDSAIEVSGECVTPKRSCRRSDMKASARKTPKSALKCAFEVMRSRRSGASRANLKVVGSWADIVKFGQIKPQVERGTKKTATKQKAAKKTKPVKSKTPARRLKNYTSTGHADSPATIVIGKAYLRATQPVGAAPKIISNVSLFKKDMKMDEDLTGVADIFKTPANRKQSLTDGEYPETPLGFPVSSLPEMSVMNTPEESGEMLVSPMSVTSTVKLGRYNSEAVTRLLQDNQDSGSINEDGSQMDHSNNLPASGEEETVPQIMVRTPQLKLAPLECLTGLKKLMRTPKERPEPIEDLRGKLLKTPKEPKSIQEDNFEGVKELLNTPKQKETPKRLMKTPNVRSSPKNKAELEEDLTGVKQLMQTPKLKGNPVENAFGVKRLMTTPKQKGKSVEEDFTGIQQMMKTPKQKNKHDEDDLTGLKQMMKTPKQINKPDEGLTGIQQKTKTPKQENKPVEEDLTGLKQMMKTPKQKNTPIEEDLTGIQQKTKTPKQKNELVEDLTGIQQMTPKQKYTPIEEDLTGIQQKTKTPKQKKELVEDLTGIQQLMKTPKQKYTPIEEDLTGIQQKTKTPKQKKELVEDLTGIQQKTKTPKQKKELVEDLTGIQQLMKTPKQKNTPIEEDLTGIQQLMKTPKQKYTPIEEDLTGIQQMMKTPKQKRQAVEDLSGVARLLQTPNERGRLVDNEVDLVEVAQNDTNESAEIQGASISVASDLAVEGANEGSEDKENICPVEGIENETQEAIQNIPQIEMAEEAITVQEEKEISPVKVICSEQPVQVCLSEVVSLAVDVSQSFSAPKEDEKAKSSFLAKKTQRGGRGKTTRESKTTDSVSPVKTESEEETTAVETVLPLSAPVKGRRGKHIVIEAVPMPNPVRKSSRGRIPKCQVKDKEDHTQGLKASQDVEPVSKCQNIPVKPRRGRKIEQGAAEFETVSHMNVAETKSVESSGEVEASLKSPAPATKGKRGQKGKHESENSLSISPPQEVKMPEAADKDDVQESSELQSSAVVDAPVKTNTRTRRGRLTKKETQKTTHIQEITKSASDIVELGLLSSAVVVTEEPQMSVKPGRGRRAKPGSSKDLLAVDEAKTDVEVVPIESGQKPACSTVKSKNLRTEEREIADDHPVIAEIPESAEHVGPVVKNVRGGRRTRQPKAAQPDVQENVDKSEVNSDVVEQSEVPVKLVRGRRTVIKDEPEAPLKRGRRVAAAAAATAVAVPPVVKSIRGRKAAVKAEHKEAAVELATDTKLVLSDPLETPVSQASSEGAVNAEDGASEVSTRRGRGRYAKKEKVSITENSVKVEDTTIKRSKAGIENKRKTSKKAVNWNSDLVTWKNIEALDPSAAEEESQISNKEEPEAPTNEELSISKNNQSADPPVKGRRGRVAKKQNEPLTETTAENDAPVVRRGRTGASLVSKSGEVPAYPKRGTKRKGIDETADTTVESLPKIRKGKAASPEAQSEVATPSKRSKAAAKEVPEESPLAEGEVNEPASIKDGNKPVRGKRKAVQEVGSVPAQPEDPGSEPSTRRGTRGQKKTGAETSLAPVRRTRRK